MIMARPVLIEPERAKRIADLILAGNNAETAAMACGVSRASYYAWMARGRAERDRLDADPKSKPKLSEAIYLEFLDTIEKAKAEAEARLVVLIQKAAQTPRTWQAAAWLLERRDPKNWGRVTRTEISGVDGKPIEARAVPLSDADIIAMADRITSIQSLPPAPTEE
jgi:transposase